MLLEVAQVDEVCRAQSPYLGIRRWYQNDELYRFYQPVGKQYTYGKGMKQLSEVEQLRLQVELLKKYQSLIRKSTK